MQHKKQMIVRRRMFAELADAVRVAPVTVLLGARQTGKTTLARQFAADVADTHFFDLEQASDRRAVAEPELALRELTGLVVIDESQRQPELFTALRPMADRDPLPARFLLLGSASPDLMRGVSESLAGRVRHVHVPGFALDEVGPEQMDRLWLRGGFPRSFLAETDADSLRWRDAFMTSFLERDVPQLGIRVPAETLRRFWNMMAHFHGQLWNAAEMARSLGATEKTARHYLDILAGAYIVRVLPPWHENIGKRQVKAPKVYLRDSGILHALLAVESRHDLQSHGRYGASWEGFAIEQVLARVGDRNAYHWRTQRGAELDLLVIRHGRRYGFEFKCADAPAMTRSMHVALEDLGLEHLWVLYPGTRTYALHTKATAQPLSTWQPSEMEAGGGVPE